MGNIIVFLVMLCFSCSISFADTEKRNEEKEKRYKKYEREQNEKYEFEKRLNEKALNDMVNQSALRTTGTYERCIDPHTEKDKELCMDEGDIAKSLAPEACQNLRKNGYKPLPKICDNFPTR